MNRAVLTFIVVMFFSFFSIAQSSEIELEGIFQGKNLYVMNPFASSGVGFCVYEVKVNGQLTTDEINSSAFEIDLSTFQFNLGDKITVEIKHKDNCKPKVLNPEVLKPKSTFEITLINVSKEGILNWKAKNEAGKLPYIVEQFRWNKWVKVGQIEGKGTPQENDYSMKITPHSGSNKFRVKQIDYTKKPRYSQEVSYRSTKMPVSFSPNKVDNEIMFTDETMYEIYDYYGNIVSKGTGKKVDVSKLKKGDYFLNYDNQMDSFKKK